ncbi:membrane integrity lipid transport subunit YebS [Rosenbergiella australiborealis]|uniref:Membrane integrity lipid transport subunit YebS n=1 Tax=Rosenbergiella australiborealis TaxID=1544696 RepID=A0ABS5T2A1_9GAMM|nr:membrane integrity lipid transport subunit YebS [Rosenbergiella australiborealis]MBT0726282.1 membrane integrity lipid transport subunit YebS [Rosenbergiella australiborealis]
MKITAIRTPDTYTDLHRCAECDHIFHRPVLKSGQTAYCPCCRAKIARGQDWSFARICCLAALMLCLMPMAWSLPLIQIRLLGMTISASLVAGIMQMVQQGDIITAAMVSFCIIATPLAFALSLLYLLVGRQLGMNLRPVLLAIDKLKEWIMFDIYLIGVSVAAIKVKDYADIFIGYGMLAFVSLTLLYILLVIHLDVGRLWEKFYPQPRQALRPDEVKCCIHCHYSGSSDHQGRCPRCHIKMTPRLPHSLQKSWAALISAIILLFPANLLPISIIYLNGARQDDTIFSGIVSLASGNIPVAMVVFTASILVPVSKVIVLLALLISIHARCEQGLKTRIRLLRAVKWIGRWSMLDLFVISLMMSLVDRDQLLAFTMGPAAVYFGSAVFLTILSVEWLDSRLLWDAHATGNAEYTD